MIGGGTTWIWSGVIWRNRKVPKLIWRRYAYRTAIAVYAMNHHVFHVIWEPGAEFRNAFADSFITTNHLNPLLTRFVRQGAEDATNNLVGYL